MAYAALAQRRAIGLGAAPPPTPVTPPLPTIPTTAAAVAYLQTKGKIFVSAEMSSLASTARSQILSQFNVSLPSGLPMSENEITSWASVYIAANGLPTSATEVARMANSFITSNASQIGVPPEMLAAVDLVLHMPKTPAQGLAWVENLGKSYAAKYGVPLSTDDIARCAARAACTNFGVDPRLVDVGISVLGDGKIDAADVEKIAVVAAATAGAIAFSALGIPAPIGSMIGSFIGQEVIGFAKDLFGPSDLDKQKKAYDDMLKARDVRQAQCAHAGAEAWTAYNRYWDGAVAKLQAIVSSPDLAPILARAGGVRFFGVRYDPNDIRYNHFCLLPGHTSQENPDGCPYFCTNKWDPTKKEWTPNCESIRCEGTYTPGQSTYTVTADRNTPYCTADGSPVVYWPTDWAWSDLRKLHQYTIVTLQPGGKVNGQINPYALLRYYQTERYPFFPSAGSGSNMTAVDAIQESAYMADPLVKTGIQYDCATPRVIQLLGDNTLILDQAMTFVMQDIVKTVAWQSARDSAIAARAAQDAAARAALQREAVTAAQSIAAARATYAQGLTPAQLVKYNQCVKIAPRTRYASCRAAAGGDPIVAMSDNAFAAAMATVRRSRFLGRFLIGTAFAAGLAYVAYRHRQGS